MNIFVSISLNQKERDQLVSTGFEDRFFIHEEFSEEILPTQIF